MDPPTPQSPPKKAKIAQKPKTHPPKEVTPQLMTPKKLKTWKASRNTKEILKQIDPEKTKFSSTKIVKKWTESKILSGNKFTLEKFTKYSEPVISTRKSTKLTKFATEGAARGNKSPKTMQNIPAKSTKITKKISTLKLQQKSCGKKRKNEENENPSTPSKKIAVSTENKLTTEGKSEVSKFAKSAPKISKFGNIKSLNIYKQPSWA